MIASRFSHPKFITDEDNPLIDRKYPHEMAADDGVALPQIYRFDFTEVPDFSQTVMQITPVIDAPNMMHKPNDIKRYWKMSPLLLINLCTWLNQRCHRRRPLRSKTPLLLNR